MDKVNKKMEIQLVSKTFFGKKGYFTAIEEVSFDVRDGEFLVILGPGHCGKTVLLNIMAGLDKQTGGQVLYVEDSRVVAFATTRMLQHAGFTVTHVASAEDAMDRLKMMIAAHKAPGFDLVLTDVSLKSDLGGGDLLDCIRHQFAYSKSDLPVLIMTGDNNPVRQAALLRDGANDLVHKPVEERLLIAKLQFQMRVARQRHVQAAA